VRYLLPTLFLVAAAVLIIVSIFLPYWSLVLHAPQYPQGLVVHAYLDRLEGDVQEIDGLNHYIGMRPLGEAAQLEKSISIFAIVALALLVFNAALSSSIEPFTPTILGEGVIGQFKTVAFADFGLLLACVASVLILIGLFLQRRAYKPLVDARRDATPNSSQ
jgi:hypothetical protein